MAEMTMVEAIRSALRFEMERDERVILMGEDVGQLGGVFRATDGLRQFFGPARVVDTPLAESVIAGSALGLALAGLVPIIEIQFLGFARTPITSSANRLRAAATAREEHTPRRSRCARPSAATCALRSSTAIPWSLSSPRTRDSRS